MENMTEREGSDLTQGKVDDLTNLPIPVDCGAEFFCFSDDKKRLAVSEFVLYDQTHTDANGVIHFRVVGVARRNHDAEKNP